MIDLHIHSTASDGSFSPSEILALARQSGVSAIAITDHDSIEGVRQLAGHPFDCSPEWISGVEISCTPPETHRHLGSIHMLGYGFSIYDPKLNALLSRAVRSREERNPKIIKKLNDLGFDISMAQVEARFGAQQTGRPHIAELMKEKGFVASFREAFDLYLGKDKPAYVDKFKVSCADAIQVILDAGGIPVLAHPGLLSFSSSSETTAFIDALVKAGLQGLEVYYTDHDAHAVQYYESLALERDLVITGGSDFHGTFNTGVNLGTGKGNLQIEADVFQNLKNRIEVVRERNTNLCLLQEHIGYRFKDLSLLENALCHRSYLNENQDACVSDNERLEFLGDAVLDLCVGQQLMDKSPLKKEGELSKLRAGLVSEPALAEMARNIDLGRFIRLGKGEALSKGHEKNSILSDAYEAVMAAVYLDAGFERTYALVQDLFLRPLESLVAGDSVDDYKSRLQEYVQENGGEAPQYMVLKESGPDHDKTFEVGTSAMNVMSAGSGKSKKAAEQEAAKNLFHLLQKNKG